MSNLTRRMEAKDLSAVRDLCLELGYEVAPEDLKTRFEFINERSNHCLFVAETEGKVVGWSHVFLTPALTDKHRSEIAGLVVHPKYRKKGIGRELNSACEKWSVEQNCENIRVRSQAMRESAYEFCRSLGYDLRKIQNVFTKALDSI